MRILSILALLALLIAPFTAQAATPPFVNAANLTITTGGTWQSLFAVNSGRASITIENMCSATTQGIGSAESLFVYLIPVGGNCLASGTAGAFELGSCGSFSQSINTTTQAVCIYAATTGHAFYGAQQ